MPKGKRSQRDLEELEKEKRLVLQQQQEELEDVEPEDDDPEEIEEPTDDIKSFDTLAKEFKANEGWVHIWLQKDKQPKVKIGKYRPIEFDRDVIASNYGGGLYYYDLRDKYGKRIATDEQRYANNEADYGDKPTGNQNSDSLNQALSLVEKLTNDIAELKAEMNSNKSTQTQDSIVALIASMNEQNKAQQAQNLELFKSLLTAQQPKQEQNTLKDFLAMFSTIKSMIPEQKEEKTSIADTIALVNAINDLKENGVDTSNRSLGDIVKDFLTDGSLVNIISSFKKKPIVPAPTQQQPQIIGGVAGVQNQNPKPELEAPKPTVEEQAYNTVIQIFKQHEKSLLNLKVQGYSAEDTGNTILNLSALAPDLKEIFYIAFKNPTTMTDLLMKNTTLFSNDVDYIKGICLFIHNTFNELEEQEQEQEQEK